MTLKPENNDDAMEALDDLVFLWSELSLSKGIETIRNRLEQCAEYEKRIEGLEGLKFKGITTTSVFVDNTDLVNHGIDIAIKHMRGE